MSTFFWEIEYIVFSQKKPFFKFIPINDTVTPPELKRVYTPENSRKMRDATSIWDI